MSLTPPSSRDASSIDGVTVTGTPSAGETIVADSATAAHWATAGGSGNGELVCDLNAEPVFQGSQSLANTGALLSSSVGRAAVSGPPVTVAAMSNVCSVVTAAPSDVPDISDTLDVVAFLYVTDTAGTNTLSVNGSSSQATPITGLGTSIDWTDTSATVVGVDLSWDGASATVASAAGGIYFCTLVVNCSPD